MKIAVRNRRNGKQKRQNDFFKIFLVILITFYSAILLKMSFQSVTINIKSNMAVHPAITVKKRLFKLISSKLVFMF